MSLNSLKHSLPRRIVILTALAFAAGACSKDSVPPIVPPPPPPPTATIGLAPSAITITDTLATSSPATVAVTVSNTGTGSLSGLTAGAVTYVTGASGWLTASLSGADAPAVLTLNVSNAGLTAGTYTATVPVNSASAANTPQTVTVTLTMLSNVPPPPPPPPPPPGPIPGVTLVAAGNIAQCGNGNNLAVASSNAIEAANPDYVFALGDNAYPPIGSGLPSSLADYQNCYGPNWGRFLAKTYAAVGNREQDTTTGPTTRGFSHGADSYYGAARVGPPGSNYYSFDVGTGASRWHIIVLDIISGGPTVPVPYGFGSAQLNWLTNDLLANTAKCTLAFWHDPMWMSSNTAGKNGYRRQPQRGIWALLYDKNVDVVLGSGDHTYERFAPMMYYNPNNDATGPEYAADSTRGIRQFTTGLGGDGSSTATYLHPLSEYRSGGNGVLKMTLGDGIYTWQFLNATGSNVQDSGTGSCH